MLRALGQTRSILPPIHWKPFTCSCIIRITAIATNIGHEDSDDTGGASCPNRFVLHTKIRRRRKNVRARIVVRSGSHSAKTRSDLPHGRGEVSFFILCFSSSRTEWKCSLLQKAISNKWQVHFVHCFSTVFSTRFIHSKPLGQTLPLLGDLKLREDLHRATLHLFLQHPIVFVLFSRYYACLPKSVPPLQIVAQANADRGTHKPYAS